MEMFADCLQLMVSPYNWLNVICTAFIVTAIGLVNHYYYTGE